MNEENKRKTIILTFIGALTLLFVVVGGTFAYFQIVNTGEGETKSTLTGETEGLTKYGTPTLTQGTNKLHINLKASDMAVSKSGTEYWATNVEEKDYEENKQQHIISTAGISGAESEDTELSCTSELTIKGKITEMVDGAPTEVTVNPFDEKDGYVYLGSKNGNGNKVSINPTQIDLKQIIDKSLNDGVEYQIEISYTIKGNTSIDITVDIDIINRDANQNSLAGKSINFTITNKNISCSVKEKEDKAYMKVLATYNHQLTSLIDEEYRDNIESVQFVKNVPSEEELSSKIKYWDLTDTELSPDKSVIGWIENGSQDEYAGQLYTLYIGSKSEIYAIDLSFAFMAMYNLKEINFDNLNTGETTDMNSMFTDCENLVTLDLSSFDTSKVANMSNMFGSSLPDNGLKATITFPKKFGSSTTDMSWMFYAYKGTTLDLSNFDTSQVIDMSYMFASDGPGGSNLIEIKGLENFVTTNVENMSYMFKNNNKLITLNLSSFDTSKVTDMNSMFHSCGSLRELDLSSFIFDNVEKFSDMFSGTSDVGYIPNDIHIIIKQGQDEFIRQRLSEDGVKNPNIEVVS